MLRRLFRLVLPRRSHALLDAPLERTAADARNELRYVEIVGADGDPFLRHRYAEGVRWRQVLRAYQPPPARVLDLGAGNGAVELAMSAGGYRVVSVDAGWNDDARRLGVLRVVADAAALPFRTASFDALLMLETVEHLPDVSAAARECARVLHASAPALVTTPPRWRYALRPDPHFSIRFLLLRSPRTQRRIAARRGFAEQHHYVDRIYGSVSELARALASFRTEEVLSRSRLPKRWFWDAVVMRKR
ncbi:MAG: class I SAM-dependent methyltransferase [Acidobacteria bacterium]|nr:class I SAM-dependent methyltransferase [Acidobacteriota bacterium]